MMKLNNRPTCFFSYKDCIGGGFVGIGITVIFWVLQSGLPSRLSEGFIDLAFGFSIGILIATGIYGVTYIIKKICRERFQNVWVILIAGFGVSFILFYGAECLVRVLCIELFSPRMMVYNSIGVAIITAFVTLFIFYLEEKDQKLILESENRKLAVMEERNRLARELHDSVSQVLFGMNLNLNSLQTLIRDDPEKAGYIAGELQKMVEEVQAEMRLMIYELQPAALLKKGFFEAIDCLVELFRTRYHQNIRCCIEGTEDGIEERVQMTLYRILQESLNNIVKHAGATEIEIDLKVSESHGELSVRDNGCGFIPGSMSRVGKFGIEGMEGRMREIGGDFYIRSKPGGGTTVSASV